MKKSLSLLLALALVFTCLIAQAESVSVYQSDFTKGADGWVARSAGTAQIRTVDGALRITGRESNWNSPGRDFDLIPDGQYRLSVQVYQDTLDSAEFMISVAHTKFGNETYENLARGVALKGEWTTLEGVYFAGDYDRFVLYVETVDTPAFAHLSFDIRDFRVEAPNGLPQRKPTEAPMKIEAVSDMPSLKEVYAGKFDFGTAVPGMVIKNSSMMRFVESQFSIVTPENELKPDSVLDVAASKRLAATDETAAAVHFNAAAPLLDYAKENGLKVHGHVLVWHSQTPEAFFHEGYDAKKPFVTREVMLGRLENYIRGVMEYMEENYPGVIVSWDVVNEAVDDGPGQLRSSNWTKVVGGDFIERAFELARKYAPEGTLLYYNDYNTAMPAKLAGIIRVLERLIKEGTVDGYGFQMHHSVGSPSMAQITTSVQRIAALGLRLRVSELDVGVDNNSEASFRMQAEKYAQIMKLLIQYSDQFEAVQVWGITDNLSWRSKNYPLLFDASRNPKPAFYAVADPDSVE